MRNRILDVRIPQKEVARVADTETLIAGLRDRMAAMTSQERMDVVSALLAGYCPHCGVPLDARDICYCTWDD